MSRAGSSVSPPGATRGESLAAYAFLAPTFLLLGLFILLPMAGALVISLQRTNGFGAFVGLDNYATLITDPLFWRSALNTVLFTLIVTPLSMALGLGVAVLLNSVLPARGVFRSILIVPMAVSGIATALIATLIFDENSGSSTNCCALPASPPSRGNREVGPRSPRWSSSPCGGAWASTCSSTWRGLQGIGEDVYEAARLDGASGWQRFRYMTVPLVGPSSFFLLIMNVIYSFQILGIIFVLTGGGPRNATSVLVTYAYDTGFVTRDQGYAAAIGMVLLLIMLTSTAIQWRTNTSRDLTG